MRGLTKVLFCFISDKPITENVYDKEFMYYTEYIYTYCAFWSAEQPCMSQAWQTDGKIELRDRQLCPRVKK